jgi:hypothetical protein
MSLPFAKEQAQRIADPLPATATWGDLMQEISCRDIIEKGLSDSTAGRTKDVREIRARYGLPE